MDKEKIGGAWNALYARMDLEDAGLNAMIQNCRPECGKVFTLEYRLSAIILHTLVTDTFVESQAYAQLLKSLGGDAPRCLGKL